MRKVFMIVMLASVQLFSFDMGTNLIKGANAGWSGIFGKTADCNTSDCDYINISGVDEEKEKFQKVLNDNLKLSDVLKSKKVEKSGLTDEEKMAEEAVKINILKAAVGIANIEKKTAGVESVIKEDANKSKESAAEPVWVKKVTAGMNNYDSPVIRADIYSGVVGNASVPMHIKTALSQNAQATEAEIAKELLLDYQGGLLSIRFDLQDFVYKSYKGVMGHETKDGDAYGLSFQTGVKMDSIKRTENGVEEDERVYVPFVGLIGQMDFGVYNTERTNDNEGILQLGFNVAYEYLNPYMVEVLENNVEEHEGVVGLYGNLKVTKTFGINVSYSTAISHFQDAKRFFVSFDFYPSK